MPLRVKPKAVSFLLGQLNDSEILKKKCIPRVYLTSYLGYPKFARLCELCGSPQLCFSFSELMMVENELASIRTARSDAATSTSSKTKGAKEIITTVN